MNGARSLLQRPGFCMGTDFAGRMEKPSYREIAGLSFAWLGQRDSNPRNRHQNEVTNLNKPSSCDYASNIPANIMTVAPYLT